ncbi:tetratricopeptide repeat protein [Chloroflexota bacterium]
METASELITISPHWALIIIGGLFVLVFGTAAIHRREGLSARFALEALGLTALMAAGSWLLSFQLSPILFLVLLYVVTMRARISVDLGTMLVQRERRDLAFRLYELGLRLSSDAASRFMVLANKGAAEVYLEWPDAAISTLSNALSAEPLPPFSQRYEAASHHNLGRAFELQGDTAAAIEHYRQAIEALPGSEFAKAAEASLQKHGDSLSTD